MESQLCRPDQEGRFDFAGHNQTVRLTCPCWSMVVHLIGPGFGLKRCVRLDTTTLLVVTVLIPVIFVPCLHLLASILLTAGRFPSRILSLTYNPILFLHSVPLRTKHSIRSTSTGKPGYQSPNTGDFQSFP